MSRRSVGNFPRPQKAPALELARPASAPQIIPAGARLDLGELRARVGESVARRFFEARGNNSEVHLTEVELALLCATAATVSHVWESNA